MNERTIQNEHSLESNHALIQIDNVGVSLGGKPILTDISWRLHPRENWAFTGGNGAGKTTLIRLIRGEVWPDPNHPGKRVYRLDGEEHSVPIGVREKAPIVSAELQDAYIRNRWNLTCREVLYTGYANSVWLFRKPSPTQCEKALKIVETLGVSHLLDRSFLETSRGEARKILIARAMVTDPPLLILDEFCNGLDRSTRLDLSDWLEGVVQNGTQLIYITHRLEELIPSISHVLILDNGRIVKQGKRELILKPSDSGSFHVKNAKPARVLPMQNTASTDDRSETWIQIENCDVYRKELRVLNQINWSMKSDENWAVLGANGSGKSSFLHLLHGDLHPALGGNIRRFGVDDGEISVWDLKKRIGYLSAHFQADYEYNLTGEETVLSGFFSSVGLWEEPSGAMKQAARQWIEFFGISKLAEQNIHTMSYGQLRKILLARAMVNQPEILLLDEPCNGLDRASKSEFLGMLESLNQTTTRIVFVTHHPEELISTINRAAVVENGEIVSQGRIEEMIQKAFPDRTRSI